jgi:hypothetical protein
MYPNYRKGPKYEEYAVMFKTYAPFVFISPYADPFIFIFDFGFRKKCEGRFRGCDLNLDIFILFENIHAQRSELGKDSKRRQIAKPKLATTAITNGRLMPTFSNSLTIKGNFRDATLPVVRINTCFVALSKDRTGNFGRGA